MTADNKSSYRFTTSQHQTTRRARGGKVLVVDDMATMRRLVRQMLMEKGFVVDEAENGMMALEKIGLNLPDVVILDVEMPKMDGLECCRRIRSNPATRDIPVIITTSVSNHQKVKNAYHAGVDSYLKKPIRREELLSKVWLMLELKERRIPAVDAEHLQRSAAMSLLESFNKLNHRKRWAPDGLSEVERDSWVAMRCQLEEILFGQTRDPSRDTREFLRVPISLEVRYELDNNHKNVRATVLGDGGLFLATSDTLHLGTRLMLQSPPTGTSEMLQVLGEVVWIRTQGASHYHGMGIKFIDLTQEQRRRIHSLVDTNVMERLLRGSTNHATL